MKVIILIPAFNEASVIREVINSLPEKIKTKRTTLSTEVVVVDDYSNDDTSFEVLKSKNKPILIKHLLNTGAGGATRTGIKYAKEFGADYVVAIDGDGQHDINDAIRCLDHAIESSSDLVVGNRLFKPLGMPRYKTVGNHFISKLTGLILGVYVPDSQCGLRVYSKKAIKKLDWDENGYIFCSEMLLAAKRMGLKISSCEIKAIYTDYSKSKGQSSWNAINMIRRIISIRMFGGYGIR